MPYPTIHRYLAHLAALAFRNLARLPVSPRPYNLLEPGASSLHLLDLRLTLFRQFALYRLVNHRQALCLFTLPGRPLAFTASPHYTALRTLVKLSVQA